MSVLLRSVAFFRGCAFLIPPAFREGPQLGQERVDGARLSVFLLPPLQHFRANLRPPIKPSHHHLTHPPNTHTPPCFSYSWVPSQLELELKMGLVASLQDSPFMVFVPLYNPLPH